MATSAANRGKYAEGKVKALLKKLEAANCIHHRFPDRRAGSFVTAPADFMILQDGRLRLLEVKEVDFEHRLPYANFGQDQVARMVMWSLAGAESWVLIYFKPLKAWRVLPAVHFTVRPLKNHLNKPIGSWFLQEVPTTTLEQAMGLIRSR